MFALAAQIRRPLLSASTALPSAGVQRRRGFASTALAMSITTITSQEQFQKLACGSKPLIVDYWAAWCGPCKTISPIFKKLSESTPQLEFASIDVDAQDGGQELAQMHGIRAMPTFAVFVNGERVLQQIGADPKKLEDLIAKAGEVA